MRKAIAGGLARAWGLRRPASLPSHRASAVPRDPAELPAPKRLRTPRRPRPSAAVQPPRANRLGWTARRFGFGRRLPGGDGQLPLPDSDDAPFAPEAYPRLNPEIRAFLNTPVEDCDPDLLRLVLALLARHISDNMPPELGTDARTLLSTLCERLGALPDAAGPEAPPAEEPSLVPAALNDALPTSVIEAPGTPAADNPETATAAAIDPVAPVGLVARRGPAPQGRRRPLGRRRLPADRGRSSGWRTLPARPQAPPLRRLCYAACAGPPRTMACRYWRAD